MSTETLAPSQTPKPPKTRAQALRSYDVADFPVITGREEEWRFTPLERLRGLTEGVGDHEAGKAPIWGFDEIPAGIKAQLTDTRDSRAGSTLVPFDRISALAFTRCTQTFVIEVAADTVVEQPAVFQAVGSGDEKASFGHTLIDVGALSQSVVVLHQTGSVVLADNVEVLVGDSAHLTLVTVTDWDNDAVQAQHVKFRLGRDARVVHIQVTLGGDLVRQYTSAEYAGRGGDFEAFGVYFASGDLPNGSGQHQEHRLLVDHGAPNCRSRVTYRGALQGDGAHTVWVGDVLIRAEATGTDTYEINRNLVLSDGARADSVPNLEIETGEVAGAGHASTTGRFDDEHLFYLMSRGINESEARKLVVRGFFAELIAKIPVEDLREQLIKAIDTRLIAVGE